MKSVSASSERTKSIADVQKITFYFKLREKLGFNYAGRFCNLTGWKKNHIHFFK
jgi:hypothetical protein